MKEYLATETVRVRRVRNARARGILAIMIFILPLISGLVVMGHSIFPGSTTLTGVTIAALIGIFSPALVLWLLFSKREVRTGVRFVSEGGSLVIERPKVPHHKEPHDFREVIEIPEPRLMSADFYKHPRQEIKIAAEGRIKQFDLAPDGTVTNERERDTIGGISWAIPAWEAEKISEFFQQEFNKSIKKIRF